MKYKLLRSFIFVLCFWWSLAFLLFSLEPSLTVAALTRLGTPPDVTVSALNHLKYWIDLLEAWTIPMLGWVAVSMAFGFVISSGSVIKDVLSRKRRERCDGEYRGINLTLGEFPMPVMLKSVPMRRLSASGEFGQKLEAMTPGHLALLKEIFEVIAAYPEAFPGDGHGVSLLEHTIHVVEQVLGQPDSIPLAAVAAAAHDMGKITAFKRDGGEWKRVKLHDKESGKWLALLPAWWALPEDERNALVLAVKYDHSRGALPTLSDDGRAATIAMQIIGQVSMADSQATKEEKQKVLDAHEVDALLLQTFIDEVPRLTWQDMGLPPGVKAVGWKLGKRLYFLESQLRERCLAVLDPDLTAALGGFYREKGKIAPFSIALMKVLNDQGWLVKQIGNIKVPDDMPLWKIKAGSKEFSAIIAIDVPDELLDRLPPKDTSYVLEVVGPHVVQAGSGSMSMADMSLDGVLSSGKKSRPKVEKQKPGQAREESPVSSDIPGLLPAFKASEPEVRVEKVKPPELVDSPPSPAPSISLPHPPEAAAGAAPVEKEVEAAPSPFSFDALIPGVDELQGTAPPLPETKEAVLDKPEPVIKEESLISEKSEEAPPAEMEPSSPAALGAEAAQAEVKHHGRGANAPGAKQAPAPESQKPAAKANWLDSSMYKEKHEVKKADKAPTAPSGQPSDPADKQASSGDGKQKKQQGKDKQAKAGFVDGLW